jgi:hypothetical protein
MSGKSQEKPENVPSVPGFLSPVYPDPRFPPVFRFLHSGKISEGEPVYEFERGFSSFFGLRKFRSNDRRRFCRNGKIWPFLT